jgi:succinate dehydrogenase flavin-adding protein (antitoxin of CptAB toxin-antitoxin module)
MKELDSVLTYYLDHNYESASEQDKEAFHMVLDMQDPELYFLILGKTVNDDKTISKLISQLQNTPRN